jgi:hypothetical protein
VIFSSDEAEIAAGVADITNTSYERFFTSFLWKSQRGRISPAR